MKTVDTAGAQGAPTQGVVGAGAKAARADGSLPDGAEFESALTDAERSDGSSSAEIEQVDRGKRGRNELESRVTEEVKVRLPEIRKGVETIRLKDDIPDADLEEVLRVVGVEQLETAEPTGVDVPREVPVALAAGGTLPAIEEADAASPAEPRDIEKRPVVLADGGEPDVEVDIETGVVDRLPIKDEERIPVRVTRQETHLAQALPSRALAEAAVATAAPASASASAALRGKTVDARQADHARVDVEQKLPAGTSGGDDSGDVAIVIGQQDGEGLPENLPGGSRGNNQNNEGRGVVTVASAGLDKASGQVVPNFSEAASEPAPAQQIGTRVVTEFSRASTEFGAGGAVKVLHLELAPQSLGSVTIRVSLKDDVISLNIEAQRADTAIAIEKDRELLASTLKQAGYLVDEIVAQQVDVRGAGRSETAASSLPQSGSGQEQPQSSAREFAGNEGSGQPGSRGEDGGGREASSAQAIHDNGQDELTEGLGGAVYV